MGIPAPETLVARVSAVEEARESDMLRLAEESIRRGHPEQAAIVYRKAAMRYRQDGKAQKELAVLHMWARVAPEDTAVWIGMAQLHEAAGKTRAALEAMARAAALHRHFGQHDAAEAVEARMHDVRSRFSTADLAAQTPDLVPPLPAELEQPAAQPAPRAPTGPGLDDEGPLELEIPQTGYHQAVDGAAAQAVLQRMPTPQPEAWAPHHEEEPERLPTSALEALEDEDDFEDDDDELELPPSADETFAMPAVPPSATDRDDLSPYELLASSSPTDGGLAAEDLGDSDEVDPAVLEAIAREAEEEADAYRAEEGGATVAMQALDFGPGRGPPRRFAIPEAATVMDPRAMAGDEDDDDAEAVTPLPEIGAAPTRAYSVAEIEALLKDRKR